MTSSKKAIFIFIVGVVLFLCGAWLRFNAEDLGSVKTASGTLMVANSEEYVDVALPVVWSGVTLVVLALAGWLFAESNGSYRRKSHRSSYGSAEY